jgi:hypothetical protein
MTDPCNNRRRLLELARAAGHRAHAGHTINDLRRMLGLKTWVPKSRAQSDLPNPFSSGTRTPPALRKA